MADKKISALTASTTPLAGTEVLPIVQSSTTVKVAVSDLTAGRSVSALNFIPSGSAIPTNGMYLPATNAVGIAINSANAVYVDANRNVGVGTTSLYPSTPHPLASQIRVGVTGNYFAQNNAGLGLGGAYFIDNAFVKNSTGNLAYITSAKASAVHCNGGGVFIRRSTGTDTADTAVTFVSSAVFTDAGELICGGTTDQGAYNLQCNGTAVWGAGAYVNGSDARIKDDIQPIESGLDVVQKLNPVTYKYKEDWSNDQSIQPGFIAQELLLALEGKNYVDGVVQQNDTYMSVAYQNIIPILTKAIQEQQAQIEVLTEKITALQNLTSNG